MIKKLSLVSTPIGNLKDITLRALEVLTRADAIIVEEYKYGRKMLHLLKIDLGNKELYELNEHNEKGGAKKLLEELLFKHREIALISDNGTPAIADPGRHFIGTALEYGVKITHIPGANSITAALQLSSFPTDDFYYAGFLPRRENDRRKRLERLKLLKTTLVFLDTPYRLQALMGSLKKVFSPRTRLALCCNLTENDERVIRGTIKEVVSGAANVSKKTKFVIVINNR